MTLIRRWLLFSLLCLCSWGAAATSAPDTGVHPVLAGFRVLRILEIYPDRIGWDAFSDPVRSISMPLFQSIPNMEDLYWVDFTLTELFPITSVAQVVETAPKAYRILPNYPNPFNARTTMILEIPELDYVRLAVINQCGQKVATLTKAPLQAGQHELTWDAPGLSSGINFTRFQAGHFQDVITLLLVQ